MELAREKLAQDALQKVLGNQGANEKMKQEAKKQLQESQAKTEKLKADLANPTLASSHAGDVG